MENNKALIVQYKDEINHQLSDPETLKSLMEVTFKGLQPAVAKRAMLEGFFRGFKFEDFLKKMVYAIPFKESYTLVTSIDYARQKAQGIVGKSAPTFEMDGKTIVSCTVTVKKKIAGEVGDFTATVYFDEYYKAGKNGYPSLWDSKPRTMIAKIAEMHALRMASPEQLNKVYTEEEFDKENAREVEYRVMPRRQTETYEGEEIPDDAVVTSTGDDTAGIEPAEQEIPSDEESQLNLINAKALRKWPEASSKELPKKIKDFTGIGLEANNYKTIIKMLS